MGNNEVQTRVKYNFLIQFTKEKETLYKQNIRKLCQKKLILFKFLHQS